MANDIDDPKFVKMPTLRGKPGRISADAPEQAKRDEFGRRVQAGITRLGWNQSELARRAGPLLSRGRLDRAEVSRFVSGKATPSAEHLQALSEVLGCTVADLWPADDGADAAPLTLNIVGDRGDLTQEVEGRGMVSWDVGMAIIALLPKGWANDAPHKATSADREAIKDEFRKNLRRVIQATGMSGAEVGRVVSRRTPPGHTIGRDRIFDYLKGRCLPSATNLTALCEGLEIDLSDLLPPQFFPELSGKASRLDFHLIAPGKMWMEISGRFDLGTSLKIQALVAANQG